MNYLLKPRKLLEEWRAAYKGYGWWYLLKRYVKWHYNLRFNMGMHWHVHHAQLIEFCFDVKGRRKAIRCNKTFVVERLRLMKRIKVRSLPKPVRQALREYTRCRRRYYFNIPDSWSAMRKADSQLSRAADECRSELYALHKKECPNCNWNDHEVNYALLAEGAKANGKKTN